MKKLWFVLTFFACLPVFARNEIGNLGSPTTAVHVQDPETEYQQYIKDNADDLKVEYDKLENQTVITTNFGRGWANGNELEFLKKGDVDLFNSVSIELKPRIVIAGNPDTSDQFTLIFRATLLPYKTSLARRWRPTTRDFRFADCNDFHWWVDGEPFEYESEKYSNQLGSDQFDTSEFFTVELTKDQFEKLARAKSVECKICHAEFLFNEKHFWVLRWLDEKYHESKDPKERAL